MNPIHTKIMKTVLMGATLCGLAQSVVSQESGVGESMSVENCGIERLVIEVQGGNALFSFYFGGIEIEIVGEERDDFVLEMKDERSGATLSAVRPHFVKNGKTLSATLDFGGFRLFRLGGGTTHVRLLVPYSFQGALEASISEGKIHLHDVSLFSVSLSVNVGSLNLERVCATEMGLRTREASTTLSAVSADSGTMKTGFGSIKARSLSGSWTVVSAEGSVNFALANDFGPIDITTSFGKVAIDLPAKSVFRFEGSGRLRKPVSDFPLMETVIREFPAERRVYTGEVGLGGPLIRVRTAEGGIGITRRDR